MPKSKSAKKSESDQVEISYETPSGKKTSTVTLPIQPGVGERIINRAERDGCTDLAAVREQINKLYGEEE
jgi:hypothetical protein